MGPETAGHVVGPPLFGLPYQLGKIAYEHDGRILRGRVTGGGNGFSYRAEGDVATPFTPCEAGSLDEFLLERYTAFTEWRGLRRKFRVQHEPWPQTRVRATIQDESLLRGHFAWWTEAQLVGANFSPGVSAVTIGIPQLANKNR